MLSRAGASRVTARLAGLVWVTRRTDRRVGEIHDQRATLALLLSLLSRAGVAEEWRSC